MPAMGARHGPKPKAKRFPPPGKRINGQLKSILNRLFPLGREFFNLKKWWSFQVCIDLFSCMFPSLSSCNKRRIHPQRVRGRNQRKDWSDRGLHTDPWSSPLGLFPGGNGPLMGRLYSTHFSPLCPRCRREGSWEAFVIETIQSCWQLIFLTIPTS